MSLRIVFMGTPAFAVPSLATLVEHGYAVVGVVTSTDKYGGRGNKQLLASPVKQYAVPHDIPVLQPSNLKAPDFVAELRALEADLYVVVAFRMLPEVVWTIPRLGTFNLHGSLLPKYRGAAPINWAIIKGEQETGVTTFFIQQQIDTGDILLQERLPIGANETAGSLHDRMMVLGAEVVLATVQTIERGDFQLQRQDDQQATKAPKIYHDTCQIDFAQPTQAVHNFIRGLSPYPAAWTTLDGQKLKLLDSKPEWETHDHPPGQLFTDQKNWLKFSTTDGYVSIGELQLQGRRKMKIKDFLNGYQFN